MKKTLEKFAEIAKLQGKKSSVKEYLNNYMNMKIFKKIKNILIIY